MTQRTDPNIYCSRDCERIGLMCLSCYQRVDMGLYADGADDDGGCDELNPYCGDCYLCEARADDDYWWEVNRADVLQI